MKTMKFPVSEVNEIDFRAVESFDEYMFANLVMAELSELLGAGKNEIEINDLRELRIRCEDCAAFKPIGCEYEYSVVWDGSNTFSYRTNRRGSSFNTEYMTFEMIGRREARTVEHDGDEAVVTFFDSPRDMAKFIFSKMLED